MSRDLRGLYSVIENNSVRDFLRATPYPAGGESSEIDNFLNKNREVFFDEIYISSKNTSLFLFRKLSISDDSPPAGYGVALKKSLTLLFSITLYNPLKSLLIFNLLIILFRHFINITFISVRFQSEILL